MKCFIPAAGFGKRMGDYTKELPKPLLPVNGFPLIYYSLYLAHKLGATDIVINLHYKNEKILTELKNFSHLNIHFSIEANEILGTAGGMKTATEKIWEDNDYFLVINPDAIFLPSENFQAIPFGYSGDALLYLLPCPLDADYTSLELKEGKIYFTNGRYYYIGISVLRKSILKSVPINTYFDLSEIFRDLSIEGRLDGAIFDGEVFDCGNFEKYSKNKDMNVFGVNEFAEFEKFCKGYDLS